MVYLTMLVCLPLLVTDVKDGRFTHETDTVSINAPSLINYNEVAQIVTLKSYSPDNQTIDSITIRFLNGDSTDFSRGKNCQPGQFYEYNYNGWVYGVSSSSLRYVKDSLFVLQDSTGKPVAYTVTPYDTLEFGIYQITNCPFCGRMPSFPKTTEYRYVFFYPGGADSVTVIAEGSLFVHSAPGVVRQPVRKATGNAIFTIAGRKLQKGTMNYLGVVVDGNSVRQHLLKKPALLRRP